LRVLARSSAGLNAMTQAFLDSAECEPANGAAHEGVAEPQPFRETQVPTA
jgi:hypothetical protein